MSKNVKKTNKPKTNNTRSAAAKGYVKETKKVEVVEEAPKKKGLFGRLFGKKK